MIILTGHTGDYLVNLLTFFDLSLVEGCYQLTKYMAFDEDNAIIDEMKQRYYKLYFKTSKEERHSGSVG